MAATIQALRVKEKNVRAVVATSAIRTKRRAVPRTTG